MKRSFRWIVLLWFCSEINGIACTNIIGYLDPIPFNICEDQSFHLLYDSSTEKRDPGDTLIYVVTTDPDETSASVGTFIKMLNSLEVNIEISYMTYGVTYYIFALLGQSNGNGGIDFRKGCVQLSGPKPFVFYEIPKPYAGRDTSICGTVIDLNGIQSVTGSNLSWRVVAGGAAQFANDASASTIVNTQGQLGTFLFVFSEDNHSCAAADSISVTFNPSPIIQVDEKICVDDNDPRYPYVATIRITDGQSPFKIVQGNGSINGNIYTTDTLTSLHNFTVRISDANGCSSNLIIDTYNCNCGATMLDTIAGKDKRQIGLLSKLNATAISKGSWKQVSGPGSAVFENIANPKSRVRVNVFGKYCFKWFAEDDPCVKGTVCVEFYKIKTADPDIPKKIFEDQFNSGTSAIVDENTFQNFQQSKQAVVKDTCMNEVGYIDLTPAIYCENDIAYIFYGAVTQRPYPNDTVIFIITDNPDPGLVKTGVYKRLLSSYSFPFDPVIMKLDSIYFIFALLGPVNGKGSIDFSANCIKVSNAKPFLFIKCNWDCGELDAGRLDSSITELCVDQCTSIKNLIPEVLDPEDVVMYVFHQSTYNDKVIPRIDTFYSVNEFVCFDTAKGMQTGITYYITRVVGNDTVSPGPDNIVDFNDPCLRASNNQPVVWYPYPAVNAGKDIRQRSLIAKLNAVSYFPGYWRIISGPGPVVFEDPENRTSKVRVNTYGKYCFVWAADFKGCVSQDTVCVDFYKVKIADPDSPNKIFEDRDISAEEEYNQVSVFTPSLISSSGSSFILFDGECKTPVNYTWYDYMGKEISNGVFNIEPGNSRSNITSPVHVGFYVLGIEIDGVLFGRRVCIQW